MYIIPAIDIINGKCVRLSKGDYSSKKEYSSDPLSVAKDYENAGLNKLHLVDLDGAKKRQVVNFNVLELIAKETGLEIDFGGGIQSNEDIKRVFDAGANQVTAGSVAIRQPDLLAEWLKTWGVEKIILGADVNGDKVAIGAWEEDSDYTWRDFLKEKLSLGIIYIISTDVQKDGMLEGPSFDLYRQMSTEFSELKVVASGGVSSKDDLLKLESMGLYGAIVGKAFYEGRISLEDLSAINNRKL